LNGFIAVLAGRLPEFLDSRFVVKNEGREGKNQNRKKKILEYNINVFFFFFK